MSGFCQATIIAWPVPGPGCSSCSAFKPQRGKGYEYPNKSTSSEQGCQANHAAKYKSLQMKMLAANKGILYLATQISMAAWAVCSEYTVQQKSSKKQKLASECAPRTQRIAFWQERKVGKYCRSTSSLGVTTTPGLNDSLTSDIRCLSGVEAVLTEDSSRTTCCTEESSRKVAAQCFPRPF